MHTKHRELLRTSIENALFRLLHSAAAATHVDGCSLRPAVPFHCRQSSFVSTVVGTVPGGVASRKVVDATTPTMASPDGLGQRAKRVALYASMCTLAKRICIVMLTPRFAMSLVIERTVLP